MADLFISYAREDTARASAIASALEAEGFTVFWDSEIPAGQTWADYIETKLRNSSAVLVLWSQISTQSQWVREEARMGRDAGKLIPVQLDGAMPPFGFGEVQAANLQNWTGDRADAGWQRLVGAIRYAIEKNGQTPPPARAAPPAAASAPAPAPAARPQAASAPQAFAAAAPAAAAKSGIKPIWIIGAAGLGLVGLIAVAASLSGAPSAPSTSVSYSQAVPSQDYALPAPVQEALNAALQAEADGQAAAADAANLYALGSQAAQQGFSNVNGYTSQQLPDGTVVSGDLITWMNMQPAMLGLGNAIGLQFYGQYHQTGQTDYEMHGRATIGSATADGLWSYSAASFEFVGSVTIPGRYALTTREVGDANSAQGYGSGVITYPDGTRYVGEYRVVGMGDQAQYLRHGLGATSNAAGDILEAGRYDGDGWVADQ